MTLTLEANCQQVLRVTNWIHSCQACGRSRKAHENQMYGKKDCTMTSCVFCQCSLEAHMSEAKRLNVPKNKCRRPMGRECIILFPEKYAK